MPWKDILQEAEERGYGVHREFRNQRRPRALLIGERAAELIHVEFEERVIKEVEPKVVLHELKTQNPHRGIERFANEYLKTWPERFKSQERPLEVLPLGFTEEEQQYLRAGMLDTMFELPDRRDISAEDLATLVDVTRSQENMIGRDIHAAVTKYGSVVAIMGSTRIMPGSSLYERLPGTMSYAVINLDKKEQGELDANADFFCRSKVVLSPVRRTHAENAKKRRDMRSYKT